MTGTYALLVYNACKLGELNLGKVWATEPELPTVRKTIEAFATTPTLVTNTHSACSVHLWTPEGMDGRMGRRGGEKGVTERNSKRVQVGEHHQLHPALFF